MNNHLCNACLHSCSQICQHGSVFGECAQANKVLRSWKYLFFMAILDGYEEVLLRILRTEGPCLPEKLKDFDMTSPCSLLGIFDIIGSPRKEEQIILDLESFGRLLLVWLVTMAGHCHRLECGTAAAVACWVRVKIWPQTLPFHLQQYPLA